MEESARSDSPRGVPSGLPLKQRLAVLRDAIDQRTKAFDSMHDHARTSSTCRSILTLLRAELV